VEGFSYLLTEAKKAGFVVATKQNTSDINALELCKQLAQLPFWCEDNTLHQENPDYQKNGCCLTHTVGLPRHPATNEEMPLTPYQVEFCKKVIKITKLPHTAKTEEKLQKLIIEFKRLHHFFHLNKGRQMGFTEIVLRLIQFFCFSRYAGSNVGIIAGNNGDLAKKDLRRFARLFKNIRPVILHWIKIQESRHLSVIELVNGTIIEAFKANEEAMTGDTRYKCIFMDEAAKWRLVDDVPVFNSVEPIVRAAGGDLFLVSTPKGPTKTFYKIWKNKESTEYYKFQYNIWHTEGNLFTKKQIDTMLNSISLNPKQEYLTQFIPGKGAVMAPVLENERYKNTETLHDILEKALADAHEERELDDDHFIENNDDWDDIHEESQS